MKIDSLRKAFVISVSLIFGGLPFYRFIWPGFREIPMKNALVGVIGVLMLVAIVVAFSRWPHSSSQRENVEQIPRSDLVARRAKFLMYVGLVCIFLPVLAIVISTSGAVGAPFHLSSQVLGEIGGSLTALGIALIIFRMPIARKLVRRQ